MNLQASEDLSRDLSDTVNILDRHIHSQSNLGLKRKKTVNIILEDGFEAEE